MRHRALFWLPAFALLVAACGEGGPVDPPEDADLQEDAALSAVLPDLAPEPGTAGTDRYVPTLERVLTRALRVVREKQGDEAAARVLAEARSLARAVREAREAGDTAAVKDGVQRLEAFEARVGLRVFGVSLLRWVHQDAAGRLEALGARLKEASDAGRDVSRIADGAKLVRRYLAAAREAAGNERPVVALIHAAHALDLVIRLGAALS